MVEQETELEFIEPDEGFNFGKGEQFSHPQLVMITQRKCIEAGCKEMRQGYYNEKRDKFGNNIITYNPDTRKEFIECVETLKMVMASDLDEPTETKLKEIEQEMQTLFDGYSKKEKEQWDILPTPLTNQWKRQGLFYREGMLSEKFSFYIEFLIDKVLIYRNIFAVLDKRARDLGYYKEGIREA